MRNRLGWMGGCAAAALLLLASIAGRAAADTVTNVRAQQPPDLVVEGNPGLPGMPVPLPVLTGESRFFVAPYPLAACVADGQTLCLLNSRFQVTASYIDYSSGTGAGHAVGLTSDTGYFWFFSAANIEAFVKIVPFCSGGYNNVAVYANGLTDLGVTLTVTDTLMSLVKTYSNSLGHPYALVRDGPFTCPVGGSFTGAVTDPTGDAVATGPAPYPDLVAATAHCQSGSCTFSVRFAPGTYSPTLTGTQIMLDTDQDPATGCPGTNAAGTTDRGIIGSEYLLNVDMPTSSARVLRYNGTGNSFSSLGDFGSVTVLAAGFDLVLPLSAVGNDDGRMNFKVISSTRLSAIGFTGGLDYMPDTGLPAGRIE